MTNTDRFKVVILRVLSVNEKRLLSLVVAVRRELQRSEVYRGDLTQAVRSALKRLIAEGAVREADGAYSLGCASPQRAGRAD